MNNQPYPAPDPSRPPGAARRRAAALLLTLVAATLALTGVATLVGAAPSPIAGGGLCVRPSGGNGCHATIGAALAQAQAGDLIRVAGGTYVENVTISQTVTLQGGWSPDFTIRHLDDFSSTIRPADNTRSVVRVQGQFADPAAVSPTLDGFVITGGRADLGSNHGGGVSLIDSHARIISNTIRNNVAFLLGGGVWVQRGAPILQGNVISANLSVGLGQDAHGGGVQLENSLATLRENIVAGNVVSGTETFGGGVEIVGSGGGAVSLQGNLFISNTADFGGGVAVINASAQLVASRFISNTAALGGGGLYLRGSFEDCCNLTGQDTLFQGNVAALGGGFYIEGDGEDCCQFRGDGAVLRQNTAGQGGGGYIGGDVGDCCQFWGQGAVLQQNAADDGGGVYNDAQFAALDGGLLISNTAAARGGGLFIAAGGMISLTHSAAIGNAAVMDGGGIYNSGAISLTNATVSGNSAGGMGGGVANMATVVLRNVSVADNSGADGAGFFNAGMVNTWNSLLAVNIGDNCSGVMTSHGHNLEDGGTCALGQPSDQSNADPALALLAANGGGTPTHALAAGSPAVDAGDNAACGATDQRGAARPVDGDGDGVAVCDIGAYEYGGLVPWLYLPLIAE